MVRCHVLGRSILEVGNFRVTPESDVTFGALLYVCANAGRGIDRHDLAQMLWPTRTQKHARQCLRQCIYRLTQMGAPLTKSGTEIRLSPQSIWFDWQHVSEHVSVEATENTADLRVLPGYDGAFSDRYARWVDDFRTTVRRAVLPFLVDRLGNALGTCNWDTAARLASNCVQLDPFHLQGVLGLAEARAMLGHPVEAEQLLRSFLDDLPVDATRARMDAHQLLGRLSQLPKRSDSVDSDGLPLVGRHGVLNLVREMLPRERGTHLPGCIISGSAGVGKSRLMRELAKLANLQGVSVLHVCCREIDIDRPLGAFSQILPRLLSLPGALGCKPEHLTLLSKATTLDRTFFLDPTTSPSPESVFAAVFSALVDLFEAVTEEERLLLVIDDAHLADTSSLELATALVDIGRTNPLTIVLAVRESEGRWRFGCPPRLQSFAQQRLSPLDPEASALLVDAFLSSAAASISARDREYCLRSAAGNPLFLMELLRHVLRVGHSGYLPLTIHSALSQRLALLSDEALRVLQATALLEIHATPQRLERMLQVSRVSMLRSIRELETHQIADFVQTLVCRHDLLAEAALTSVLSSELRYLHRCAAAMLQEEVEAQSSVSLLWACAHHWELAGEPEHAVAFAINKVQQLLSLGLAREAFQLASRAANMSVSIAHRLVANDLAALAARWHGQWSEVVETIEMKRALLSEGGMPNRLSPESAALLLEAKIHMDVDFSSLLANARQRVSDEDASPTERHTAGTIALVLADNLSDRTAATDLLAQLAAVQRADRTATLAWIRTQMIFETAWGSLDKAVTHAEEAVSLARCQEVSVLNRAKTLRWASFPIARIGAKEQAIELLLEALECSTRNSLRPEDSAAAAELTTLYLEHNDLANASRWLDRQNALAERHTDPMARMELSGATVRIAAATGDILKAFAALEWIRSCNTFASSTKAALARRCMLLEGRVAAGYELSHSEQDDLLAHWRGRVPFSGEDINSGAIARILARTRGDDSARLFLAEYFRIRRERFLFLQPRCPQPGTALIPSILGGDETTCLTQ
jgi:DNA-binding SARP family transcriptional activator